MQIFTFAALALIDVYTKNSDSTWKNKRFEKKNEVNPNKIDDFRAICVRELITWYDVTIFHVFVGLFRAPKLFQSLCHYILRKSKIQGLQDAEESRVKISTGKAYGILQEWYLNFPYAIFHTGFFVHEKWGDAFKKFLTNWDLTVWLCGLKRDIGYEM